MNIGILGSGIVGQTLGRALAARGHHVILGTRHPHDLDQPKGMAGPLREWLDQTGSRGQVQGYAAAAERADLLINATNGAASLEALEQAGAEHLRGKVLIDVANPLDFSQGMPPSLFVKDTDSLAEGIQRAFPEVRIVKALNTMSAHLMVDPGSLAGGDHTVLLSGNDPAARAEASALLRELGWTDLLDLGDLSAARGTEMLLPVWLRLWQTLGTAHFQFKIVR